MAHIPLTFMINGAILIQLISGSSMVMSLDAPRMECTYLSLFVLLVSYNVNDFKCRNKALQISSLRRAILIINFLRRFQSFIADTLGWWKNIMLA